MQYKNDNVVYKCYMSCRFLLQMYSDLKIKENGADAPWLSSEVYKCYMNAITTSIYTVFFYFARSTYSSVSVFTTIFSPCSTNTGT